jgi:hypothetical protein
VVVVGLLADMDGAKVHELFVLGRIIWVLVLTLLTLSYITVGLRLWVRFRITKSPGWDDAAMVATLVSVSVVQLIQ